MKQSLEILDTAHAIRYKCSIKPLYLACLAFTKHGELPTTVKLSTELLDLSELSINTTQVIFRLLTFNIRHFGSISLDTHHLVLKPNGIYLKYDEASGYLRTSEKS